MRHFLSLKDFSKDEILEIIDLALEIKSQKIKKKYLQDKTLGMIFQKSSTRTRVSFEVGIYQLGGVGLYLNANDLQIGRGESIKDSSIVISSMVDMIMIRTYSHSELEEFAKYSSVPIINGLTDSFHPVQLMADYLTIVENGLDRDLKVAYIGDGNNMTNSWIMLASKLGFELNIATPKGYEVEQDILKYAKDFHNISFTNDPKEAAKNSTIITTDTWVSMGQESEKEKRIKDFKGFIVDSELMKLGSNAKFLHCLPAYRGLEVSENVIDGDDSLIYQEAQNRLHAQKAIMVWLDNASRS